MRFLNTIKTLTLLLCLSCGANRGESSKDTGDNIDLVDQELMLDIEENPRPDNDGGLLIPIPEVVVEENPHPRGHLDPDPNPGPSIEIGAGIGYRIVVDAVSYSNNGVQLEISVSGTNPNHARQHLRVQLGNEQKIVSLTYRLTNAKIQLQFQSGLTLFADNDTPIEFSIVDIHDNTSEKFDIFCYEIPEDRFQNPVSETGICH